MSDKPISPLRVRMIQDMTVRNFVPDTQREYIRAVKKLAASPIKFACHPPATGSRFIRTVSFDPFSSANKSFVSSNLEKSL